MSQELAQTNITNFSPEHLISQAIEKGLPVDTMEKLLAMRKELKAEFSKEAFDAAMSKFQAECPIIEKTKNGPSGAYKYAPIEEIVRQVKGQLEQNGFSYSIQTQMLNDKVKVTCIVKHKFGHSEPSDVELPLANKTGMMNAPQQTAATMTYAKRYAFCNAFGITTGDEDTDGTDVITHPRTPYTASSKPVEKSSVVKTTPTPSDQKKLKIKELCDYLNPLLKTGNEYETYVFNKTQLALKPENYDEIVNRLTILADEKKANSDPQKLAEAFGGTVVS